MSVLSNVLLATSAAVLVSCGGDSQDVNKTNERLSLISQNKVIWANQQIRDYEFTYQTRPIDCPTVDPYPAVVITVKNSLVTSVYVPALGTYNQEITSWPTLDGVFEKLNSVVISNPEVFAKSISEPNAAPVFNEKYGFPIELAVDQSAANCDGISFRVSDFK